jgi:biopolymer transport protein ExbB/TolQ
MTLSAEARGALRRYAHLAPIIGVVGTSVGIVKAFRIIGDGNVSVAGVVGLSLSMSVAATLFVVLLVLAGCFVYERQRSSRAA